MTPKAHRIAECASNFCTTLTGGNLGLRPETADTRTMGLVLNPRFARSPVITGGGPPKIRANVRLYRRGRQLRSLAANTASEIRDTGAAVITAAAAPLQQRALCNLGARYSRCVARVQAT